MAVVESFVMSPADKKGFEKIAAPDRERTSRRFRGLLAGQHRLGKAPGITCEIALWRRAPHGWVVGLTWSDGARTDARSEEVDTLDAAMTFVETEGRSAINAAVERTEPRTRAPNATEALIRPFLRRQAAVELRQAYDELASRALLDWQLALGKTEGADR